MASPLRKLDDLRNKVASRNEFYLRHVLRELQTWPDENAEVWELRAQSYYHLNRYAEAVGAAYRAYELSMDDSMLGLHAYCLILSRNDINKGVSILEGLVGRQYPNPSIYSSLARFYLTAGNPTEAIRVLNIGLGIPELHAEQGFLQLKLGYACLVADDEDTARSAFLDGFSKLLHTEIGSFRDLPIGGRDAFLDREFSPEGVGTLKNILTRWAEHDAASSKMSDRQRKFNNRLQALRSNYERRVKQVVEPYQDVELPEGSAREALDEMGAYRGTANEAGL